MTVYNAQHITELKLKLQNGNPYASATAVVVKCTKPLLRFINPFEIRVENKIENEKRKSGRKNSSMSTLYL